MREHEDDDDDVPRAFQEIFAALVKAVQPRPLLPGTVAAYWTVLRTVPLWAIRQSGDALHDARFFPNAGDWLQEAKTLAATWQEPASGSRRLEELDGLHPNDPERDAICKGLSDEDGDRLMARYGYTKVHGRWIHADDLTPAGKEA